MPILNVFQEVFQCLLRSFHAAHSLILQEEAQLTTLTAVVVLPVSDTEGKTDHIKIEIRSRFCTFLPMIYVIKI